MPNHLQKMFLFTDARHILCADLGWFTPEGTHLPLIAPPAPPNNALANTGWLPQGIRLVTLKPQSSHKYTGTFLELIFQPVQPKCPAMD